MAQIQLPAAPDALLFMWTTGPRMHFAVELMKAWGFEFLTVAVVWVKKNRGDGSTNMGMGVYTRSCCEFLLLGRRGRGVSNWVRNHSILQVLECPRREHSRKPDEIFPLLDALLIPGLRRLEMFARERRAGWDAWGNEVDHFPAASPQ